MIKPIISCIFFLIWGSGNFEIYSQIRVTNDNQAVYAVHSQKDYKPASNQKMSLVNFLKEIGVSFKVRFIYEDKIIRDKEVNSLWEKSSTLDKTLKHYLYPLGLDFKQIDDKQIIIYAAVKKDKKTLLMGSINHPNLTSASFFKAKDKKINSQIEITGLITNINGEPLAGVSVIVKDRPNVGTTSDLNGRYVLVAEEKRTLVFSMVGYETQEISINSRRNINVTLEQDASVLEETVVLAFGQKAKREDVVGAVSSISTKDLKVPSSNLTTALAGKAAGIIAFQRSGEPGQDNADFFIRGVTTFGYKVDPLILIDNMEVTTTDLARLQVDDIESFSIMKDATATAVYGARGANGVILIQTKEGKEGKAILNFRVENSLSSPTSKVELADPVTYMKMSNEAVLTRNPESSLLPYSLNQISNTELKRDPILYPTTDWRKSLLKNHTLNQRYNLSVNGGGAVARYYVSGALNQDNGLLRVPKVNNFNNNIDLKTYSLRSNVNVNLTNSTELIVRLSGSFDDYTGPLKGGTQVYRDVMRSNPVRFSPYYEPTEEYKYLQHIMFGNYDDGQGNFYLNPYAEMVKGYKNYSRSMMLAQLEVKQNLSFITEGLSFRALANTTRNSFFDISRKYNPFWYEVSLNPLSKRYQFTVLNEDKGTEFLDYDESSKEVSSVFYFEGALNYNRTFDQKHNFGGLLVSVVRNRLDGNAGSLQRSLPFRNIGVSGRFSYSYENKYFAEFNFGYNGSERFAKNKRFGFFPSAGLAWVVSNESFWSEIKPIISSLKIRGTYGIVGNDAIGSSADRFYYLSEIDMNSTNRGAMFGVDKVYKRDGIEVKRYSNPDITWETSYKRNIAVEIGILNKGNIIIDIFKEHRKNIFMPRANIPSIMGLAVQTSGNVGEAEGSGIDLSIDFNKQISPEFWIQGMANFTYASSEYKVYEEPAYPHPWMSKVGTPLSATWGYVAERLFIDDAEVAKSPVQDFGEYRAGDIKFKDLNGDNKIDEMDRIPLGYPTIPEINYGFGVSTGYKGFDLSVFFQGLARESFWISTKATAPFMRYTYSGESVSSSTILENQLLKAYADNYWSEDNQDIYALWPRLYSSEISNANTTNSWFMRDGDFLRLKQAEIGYTLPDYLSKKWKISKARIYFSGTNLFLISKFKLWDVEMAGNGLGYPLQRVFNIGCQLSL